MTAVEKLEAAIAKLEELRERTTAGPWFMTHEKSVHPYVWGNYAEDDEADLVFKTAGGWHNADLIVTLHRTIDAQLMLLRYCKDMEGTIGLRFNPLDHAALALADAILGES